jgi:hypothetical protein
MVLASRNISDKELAKIIPLDRPANSDLNVAVM